MSTKRKYVSELRASRASETRFRIQQSARQLLTVSGFDGTTINSIAAEAGVSAQTVYSVFGSKGAIVASMMTHLEDEAGQDSAIEALSLESDPRRQLRIFTSWIHRLFDLSSGVLTVVLQSPNQPDMALILEQGNARRLEGCRHLTGMWAMAGALRDGIDAEFAAEQLWVLTSIETYLSCTSGLGWDSDRYERWVTDTAERLLFR